MDVNASTGDPGDVPAEEGEPMVMTGDALATGTSKPASADRADDGVWVVGLDGSDCAANALEWAIENLPDRGTAMSLVSAWLVSGLTISASCSADISEPLVL